MRDIALEDTEHTTKAIGIKTEQLVLVCQEDRQINGLE